MKVELKKENYCGASLLSKITGHLQQIIPGLDYNEAVFIANKIERDLKEYDGIQLADGTTFEKTWTNDNNYLIKEEKR